MKCLFVASSMSFGGAERVMSILANEWVNKKNCEVKILLTGTCAKSSYNLNEKVELFSCYEKVKKTSIPHLVIMKSIRTACKTWKPDVVISFYNDLAALSIIAIKGLHIPFVYSERNDPNRVILRKIDKLYRKIVEKGADKFVFQTKGAQKCYPEFVQNKSTVILNPINTSAFPTHDYDFSKKEIVSVGRLEPQKNQKLLVDAFSIVQKDFPKYSLVIYGEGNLRNELEHYIEKKHLEEKVLLPGVVPDILNRIKGSTVFVLSSDFEGIPNALIEAMAMGLPCVSTDCSPGGARELINNEINGLITPCDDAERLATAIQKILKDKEFAKSCGKKALEIRQRVDVETISTIWLDFINSNNK